MCEATGTNEPPWTHPLAAVAASLPHDFKMEKWEQALRDVGEAAAGGGAVSALTRAGAACARLWSENAIFRLVQRVVLEEPRTSALTYIVLVLSGIVSIYAVLVTSSISKGYSNTATKGSAEFFSGKKAEKDPGGAPADGG